MKAVFQLVNGAAQRPKKPTVNTLEDARKHDRLTAAYNQMTADFAVISENIETLKNLDGGTGSSLMDAPKKPEKLGWFKGLFSANRVRHQDDTASYKSRLADWNSGGTDLAEADGVVVSTEDRNRFSANAEMKYDPANFHISETEGGFIQGLGHLKADFEFDYRSDNRFLETTSSRSAKTPASLSYSNKDGVESYELIETNWMRRDDLGYSPRDDDWERSGSKKTTRIKISPDTQTVTYFSEG